MYRVVDNLLLGVALFCTWWCVDDTLAWGLDAANLGLMPPWVIALVAGFSFIFRFIDVTSAAILGWR